jgi:hypothetical protein
MKMNDMILISTDDHICEPPSVFDNYNGKFKDRMPRVEMDSKGIDAWEFNGNRMPNLGLNAVVGRRPEEYGVEPCAFSQLRKGCYDVHARIEDMNVNGVLGSLNFPQFCNNGMAFRTNDKALSLAVVKAYNDWHIDEWAGAYPGRFIPTAIVPIWDIDESAKEALRIKKKGCHSINLFPVPNREGLPSWNSGAWDKLLAVCDDNEIVINLHINDASLATPSPESPVDVFITNMPVTLFNTASDITWSYITRKFNNIKFALSEGGSGWVPHWKERADFTYKHHRAWTHQDFGDLLPSQVFDKHFLTCFIQDRVAIENRHRTGLHNMSWECDYPHSDCTWPKSPETVFPDFEGCSDEEINLITHLNAMKTYQFDPFKYHDKTDCTVGALRATAQHVDLSYLKSEGVIRTNDAGKVPTMGDIGKRIEEAYFTK